MSQQSSETWNAVTRLLADESVSEVLIDGPQQVYVERRGRLEDSELQFGDRKELLELLRYLLAINGRVYDPHTPIYDLQLADDTRCHIVLAPVAVGGPVLNIRKLFRGEMTVERLLQYGAINEAQWHFLERCVRGRISMLIAGGSGSGKTTVTNLLLGLIPPEERVIVIEERLELQIERARMVRLIAQSSHEPQQALIDLRTLISSALRMRPDRLVFGELHGEEAFDALHAIGSGHDGSMACMHAVSPADALSRLEVLCTLGRPAVPLSHARQMIAGAFPLLVQVARLPDGVRRITQICAAELFDDSTIGLQQLFFYDEASHSFIETDAAGSFAQQQHLPPLS